MINIKLYELDKHRNECAFRPYLAIQNEFREVGIEFTSGNSYDFAWVAQASFLNKKVSLEQSVNDGLEFLSKIKGDYMLLDGQDSTSLMGSYEVFKESNALFLMKNSLLKNRNLYKNGWNLGRYYWGSGDYNLSDFDKYSDKIVLSGTNWLSTHWFGIQKSFYNLPKEYDISAMFQYPSKEEVFEHNHIQSKYYDTFRKPVVDIINKLPHKAAKLNNGERVSIEEYYNRVSKSKIILAPFGYGEMAPRDIESAIFGSILIKPDMDYVDTIPNFYIDGETYISCKHDFSDLEEKIELILGNYEYYLYIVENSRKKLLEIMNPNNIILHTYRLFTQLKNIYTNG